MLALFICDFNGIPKKNAVTCTSILYIKYCISSLNFFPQWCHGLTKAWKLLFDTEMQVSIETTVFTLSCSLKKILYLPHKSTKWHLLLFYKLLKTDAMKVHVLVYQLSLNLMNLLLLSFTSEFLFWNTCTCMCIYAPSHECCFGNTEKVTNTGV